MIRIRTTALALIAPILTAGLATGCSDTRALPAGTGLAVSLDREVGPRSASPGDAVEGRLVADLAAGDRVVLREGAVFVGRVTAVQQRDDRRPWAMAMTFDSVRVGGRTVALPLEITGVEARAASDSGGAARPGGAPAAGSGGLTGEVVGARAGAALLRRSVIQAEGEAVVLGTASAPAVLPEGSRVDLRVSRRSEVPAPDG
ncbi:MAG TPA: hypothetical protein VLL48_07440 [Longimicrobiales bacterium]|nr:hypothetical protein [Longimicrobiales bacterium]